MTRLRLPPPPPPSSMAEVLPQVQIQAPSKTPVDATHDDPTHVKEGLPKAGESNEGIGGTASSSWRSHLSHKAECANYGPTARLTQHGRNSSNRLIRNISKDASAQITDGRKEQQGGIDPLSQVCPLAVVRFADPLTASAEQQILRRTHTSNFLPVQQQKTRPGMLPEDSAAPENVESARTSSEPSLSRANTPSSAARDKR